MRVSRSSWRTTGSSSISTRAPAPAGSEDTLSRAIVEATVDEVTYDESSVRLVKRLPDSPDGLEA